MTVEKAVAVAVENSAFSFDKPFSYLLGDEECSPGCRVLVPFGRGNKCRQGIVLSVTDYDGKEKLKRISQVIDKTPVLNEDAEACRMAERKNLLHLF